MHRWMQFANLGLLRLNQPEVDSAGTQGGGTPVDSAGTQGGGTPADPAAGGDPKTDGDEAAPPKTLEEALALLQQRDDDLAAQKRVNRNLDRRSKADQRKITALTQQGKSVEQAEAEVDGEAAIQSARAAAKAEVTAQFNLKLAAATVKAALAGKVQDADYAAWLLRDKLPDITVSDGGDVDEQAVTDLVDELLHSNPNLKAAQGAAQFGSPDGGSRKAQPQSEIQQVDEQIAEAMKAGDFARSVHLKRRRQELLDQAKKG